MTQFKENKQTWLSKAFIGIILLISLATVVLTLDSAPGSHVPLNHDSSMFFYFGKGMTHGLVPYRDMLDHKGPVLFFINALAALLSFSTLHFGLFVIEGLTIAGTLWFAYLTAKLESGNAFASAFAVLLLTPFMVSTLQGGNFSEEYGLFFIMSSLYLWARIWLGQPPKHAFAAYVYIGFACAAVFFIRANMVAFWVMLIVFAVVQALRVSKARLELSRQVGGFAVGFGALTVVICAYFLANGSLKAMISAAFVMNLQYSQSSWAAKMAIADAFRQTMLNTGAMALLILGIGTLLYDRRLLHKPSWFWFLLTAGLLNFYTTIMSGRLYGHYLLTEYPYLLLIAVFALTKVLALAQKPRLLSEIVLTVLAFFLMIQPLSKPEMKLHRQQPVSEENLLNQQIATYIKKHTTPKDSIYVHLKDGSIYLASGRFSNSKFFVLPSLNWNAYPQYQKEFRQGMRQNPPKYIVMPYWTLGKKADDSSMTATMDATVKTHYRQVKRFADTRTHLFVLKK